MAASAAAAMSSSFSPSIYTVKCLRSSNQMSPLDHLHLKMAPTRMLSSSSLSNPCALEPLLSINAGSNKFRVLRVSTAVAQEEVAVTDEIEQVASLAEEDQQEEKKAEEQVVSAGDEALGGEAAAEVSGGGDEGGEAVAVNAKLYFGNLPYSVDSAQLAGIIQDYGSPELIEVLYHRDTGRSRGFAFVTMSTVEDCNAVIENLDGREFMGRTLRVNLADKPRPKVPLYPETEFKLFVGNLSWSVTSESLTKAFQEYGNVVGARVLYDGETGRSRGYGFVCYSTKSEMDTALESLDGAELEGRALRVSLAEGKRS
ncbi:28 kDa ribonucleoprotein chloroplastic [Prunus yedoensis var. nudiflora]|uniref:28 kDa ribonucleoprotein chloroplastic n=1 Tax=Prunus yedoensis var. nudiflora TaxID=2094558 RepID=A0A314YS49_PRUYE|nr:28 kDa ribonucleoprotein chloroplastic [Prunus yedoensis var. nudiflora]PQQ08969.1 28 kDa ribonucleoprotein chloroplastic [Prunus yedoensis var. nudiflora]